jgi:hypothetical protein
LMVVVTVISHTSPQVIFMADPAAGSGAAAPEDDPVVDMEVRRRRDVCCRLAALLLQTPLGRRCLSTNIVRVLLGAVVRRCAGCVGDARPARSHQKEKESWKAIRLVAALLWE